MKLVITCLFFLDDFFDFIDFNHKINREISEIRPLEMAILLGFIKKYKKI